MTNMGQVRHLSAGGFVSCEATGTGGWVCAVKGLGQSQGSVGDRQSSGSHCDRTILCWPAGRGWDRDAGSAGAFAEWAFAFQ